MPLSKWRGLGVEAEKFGYRAGLPLGGLATNSRETDVPYPEYRRIALYLELDTIVMANRL